MAKQIYKATNIETGKVVEGSAEELAEALFVVPGSIYRASWEGYRIAGVWNVERGQYREIDHPYKWTPDIYEKWDRITKPFKEVSRRKGDKMREVRRCVICNKHYIATRSNSKTCGDACSKAWGKFQVNEYNQKLKKKRVQKKQKKMSLAQINAEARAVGMTYGQYVGVMGL